MELSSPVESLPRGCSLPRTGLDRLSGCRMRPADKPVAKALLLISRRLFPQALHLSPRWLVVAYHDLLGCSSLVASGMMSGGRTASDGEQLVWPGGLPNRGEKRPYHERKGGGGGGGRSHPCRGSSMEGG